MLKPSKFDFAQIRKKTKPPVEKKPRSAVRREVISTEVILARRKKEKRETPYFTPGQIAKKELPKPKKNFTPAFSFAAAALVLIFIFQGLLFAQSAHKAQSEILGAATSAYTDLHSAQENLGSQEFSAATQLFDAALTNLQYAKDKLDNYKLLQWLAPQADSAQHVLSAASDLSEAGKKLTDALSLLGDLKVSSSGIETDNFNDKILANRQLLADSRDLVLKAQSEFDSANSLPLDYTDTVATAKQEVSQLSSILQKLVALEDIYLGIFSGQKTYLLIFQNYDEERATGGFIGTYGVLKTDNGKIDSLQIQSIYELDGQIYEEIAAPGPMQPDIKRWGIRDANWFADFPTTAQKLLFFFEKGSQTADGVISFTPKMFEDLLRLTGPIQMSDYDVTVSADNFQSLVQFKTSVDYDKTLNQPKKFLADFAPKFLDKLTGLQKDQWLLALQIFEDNLKARNILLYSRNTDMQKQITDLGFSGQLLGTDSDYLSIINTNLGGTKSDLSMDQKVNLKSKILSDGSVLNTLSIERKNNSLYSNKDYMRILVPKGSQLISADGFDDLNYYSSASAGLSTDPDLAAWDQGQAIGNVYERVESGKTEFAGWINTNPSFDRSLSLTYILPFKVQSSYSLLLQKQAGSKPFEFNGNVDLGNYKASWTGPGVAANLSMAVFNSNTNVDDFWPMVLTK